MILVAYLITKAFLFGSESGLQENVSLIARSVSIHTIDKQITVLNDRGRCEQSGNDTKMATLLVDFKRSIVLSDPVSAQVSLGFF